MRCEDSLGFLEQANSRIVTDSPKPVCWSNFRSGGNRWVSTAFHFERVVIKTHRRDDLGLLLFPKSLRLFIEFLPSPPPTKSCPFLKSSSIQILLLLREMAGTVSQWAESEMDAAKMKALVTAEKIPEKVLVEWFAAAGHDLVGGGESKNSMNSRSDLGKKVKALSHP